MIIPLDLTQLACPGFKLAAGFPSGFTTDGVGCWGEPRGEPAISPCLTGPVDYLFASRHKDPGSNPQGGTYVKPGFSLAFSRYRPIYLNLEANHSIYTKEQTIRLARTV